MVITQCPKTCLASFHAVTASSIAGFTLKLLMVVSFQQVGHDGFSPSWVRAHCKKGGRLCDKVGWGEPKWEPSRVLVSRNNVRM